MLLSKYVRMLPRELVYFVIAPFTYLTKPKEHLMDIRSFRSDFSLVDSVYSTNYTYHILLYDLLLFKHRENVSDIIVDRAMDEDSVYRQCRLMWGRLTTVQRTRFINRFIIDEIEN
jgi:hypothetical protein